MSHRSFRLEFRFGKYPQVEAEDSEAEPEASRPVLPGEKGKTAQAGEKTAGKTEEKDESGFDPAI